MRLHFAMDKNLGVCGSLYMTTVLVKNLHTAIPSPLAFSIEVFGFVAGNQLGHLVTVIYVPVYGFVFGSSAWLWIILLGNSEKGYAIRVNGMVSFLQIHWLWICCHTAPCITTPGVYIPCFWTVVIEKDPFPALSRLNITKTRALSVKTEHHHCATQHSCFWH